MSKQIQRLVHSSCLFPYDSKVLCFKILAVSLYYKRRGQTAILGFMPAPLTSVTNGDNDSFVSFRELNNCLKGKIENSITFHIQWT